ncbi:FAD-binding oxidoreductase [Acinetobacter pittii]|uniref:FAD-binding oxidoreductase n=1 Tax=Acinetobacter pittii TaxID=48296 RepID=UPI0010233AFB|nr:FAD-binding oxidoreductase [Acinetobacter pittii]RZG82974.1 FAD-binding oxidoreductase [Acinetobacter pittii]RZH57935.1 FAD-binding oxidoreductase [Acinetobacter pittii]RZH60523.1 FAD-binding oxidoreductase [Acinetobacter pittii]
MNSHEIIEELSVLLGEHRIKTDVDSLQHWGSDRTRHFEVKPLAIVFPSNTDEVQQIVQLANKLHFAITPSGGRTGLSAGAVASNGEVVVSMDKMDKIIKFYPSDRMVRLQAGVITEQLQEFALENNLFFPVDLAASGSCHLGGNISTNAGGIKVIRYGMTRNWILGLTVVTGNGDILKLNKGMVKNATGYAMQHLFIGGEGTLGLVTEADIKLDRTPQNLQVLVFGVPEFASIMPILHAFQKEIDLTAFEFFDRLVMQKVIEHSRIQPPFQTDCPYYVLLEFEAPYDIVVEKAMQIFESCMEQGFIWDGVISQTIEQAKNLWRLREDISEACASFLPYKVDVSVLITYIDDFIKEIEVFFREKYPNISICWFGHIGDGNLHLNILKPENLEKNDFYNQCKDAMKTVFATVEKYEGAISAEHGVGMTKKAYISYSRTEQEIEYMRGLKRVFDRKNIMNPGKIFD